jgi:arsenate reductase
MSKEKKLKILFLCTGNSCRSQMAEGLARHLKGDVLEAYSAGVEIHGLDPLAVKVMAEAGVDISGHKSKNVLELMHIPFDYVITVCDHAKETCPFFPGKAKHVHISFEDPPRLAKSAKNDAEALEIYRRVRDQIKDYILTLPDALYSTKENTMADPESTQTPSQEPCCGPDCGCNAKPAPSKGNKIFLAIIVLAVCGILVYKMAFRAQAAPAAGNSGFNTTGNLTPTPASVPATPASSTVEALESMNALNQKAMDKGAVMVWVPSQTVIAIPAPALSAIQSARQTIQSKGVILGLYQLQAGSKDQTGIGSQLPLPAVLILTKGRSMGTVTGDITTEKLLQAFVASNRTGGCCPSGAGSPSCKPSK